MFVRTTHYKIVIIPLQFHYNTITISSEQLSQNIGKFMFSDVRASVLLLAAPGCSWLRLAAPEATDPQNL